MLSNMEGNADYAHTRSTHRYFDIDLLIFYLPPKYPHIRPFIQGIFQRPFAIVLSFQACNNFLPVIRSYFKVKQRLGIFPPVIPKQNAPDLHFLLEIPEKRLDLCDCYLHLILACTNE